MISLRSRRADPLRVHLLAGAFLAAASAPAPAIVGGTDERGPVARHLVQVSICSGVALARDVVLTAAHCATGRVQWRNAAGATEFRETRATEIFPGYEPNANNPRVAPVDLALLRLAADLSEPFEPARLSAAPRWPGDVAVMTGFGEATPGQAETAGVLRSAEATIVEPYGPNDVAVWLERDGRVGACKGDSGGALTVDGAVAAIITSIAVRCGFRTRAILLGPQREWIDGVLASWGRAAEWID